MKLTTLFLLLMMTAGIHAQWAGTYYGTANGDKVTMTLEQVGSSVTGSMQDSQQSFTISGTVNGQQFLGTAREHTFQIDFELRAEKIGNTLDCKLILDADGSVLESSFSVTKGGNVGSVQQQPVISGAIPFPIGATFPQELSGNWTQNESYNSGSGSNFMGANFSQSVTFHSDGTLSEGGSNASMSGSNYLNQSSGEGSGKIAGAGWYAIHNNFYLLVFNEGSWNSVHVGTWFTENMHLLITTVNGEKILLSR